MRMSFLSFQTLQHSYPVIEAYDNNTGYQYFSVMYEHSISAHKLLSHIICELFHHELEAKFDNVTMINTYPIFHTLCGKFLESIYRSGKNYKDLFL